MDANADLFALDVFSILCNIPIFYVLLFILLFPPSLPPKPSPSHVLPRTFCISHQLDLCVNFLSVGVIQLGDILNSEIILTGEDEEEDEDDRSWRR